MSDEQAAEKTPNSVKSYVIKTNQGSFKIKAPAGTPKDQVIAQAISKSPKFAQVYPSIQAHQKMQDFAKTTIKKDEGAPNPVEKDALYKELSRDSQFSPKAFTPQEIAKDPTWYGRSGRYLGGELVGMGNAAIGGAAGGYKMLHDVASMVDPTDKRSAADRYSALKEDAKGAASAAKAPFEVGKVVWNVLSGHPEVAADPVKFGEKVGAMAMVTEGGIKLAKSMSEAITGLDEAQKAEAIRVSNRLSKDLGSSHLNQMGLENAYVHSKGLKVAEAITKATKEAKKEVETHATALTSQIDKAIPTGVIDATKEAKFIKDTFDHEVKTNEATNPALKRAHQAASSVPGGQWTFENAKQFRTMIGDAMTEAEGPQKKVLKKVYDDLTVKMATTAKKYGMENSWNHYNELNKKMQQYSDLTKKMYDAQTGKEVHSALVKDGAQTGELVNGLAKYGLDRKDVLGYVSKGQRILKDQNRGFSIFRLAYGTPITAAATIGAKAAGVPFMPALGIGASIGLASTSLVSYFRALRLGADAIDAVLDDRELPGKMAPDVGQFPSVQAPPPPQLPTPTAPTGNSPASFQAGTPLPQTPAQIPAPQAVPPVASVQRPPIAPVEKQLAQPAPQAVPAQLPASQAPPAQNNAPAPAQLPAPRPVAPAGQHGTGRAAQLAKKAENMRRYRETGQDKTALNKRNMAKETEEGAQRAMSQSVDFSKFEVPELEDAAKERKVKISGIQKWYRANPTRSEEYKEALKYLLIEDFEKKSGKAPE